MKAYKVRDTKTGIYSTGGYFPDWTKIGKTWSNIGHLKAHLSQIEKIPSSWEVLAMEPSSTISAKDLMQRKDDWKHTREMCS